MKTSRVVAIGGLTAHITYNWNSKRRAAELLSASVSYKGVDVTPVLNVKERAKLNAAVEQVLADSAWELEQNFIADLLRA
jgi:hypothetical protein